MLGGVSWCQPVSAGVMWYQMLSGSVKWCTHPIIQVVVGVEGVIIAEDCMEQQPTTSSLGKLYGIPI